MAPSSRVLLRTEVINANSARSGELGVPRETTFSVQIGKGTLRLHRRHGYSLFQALCQWGRSKKRVRDERGLEKNW